MPSQELRPTIHIPGTTSHTIAPSGRPESHEGTLRYLKAAPVLPWSCCTPCARRPSTSAPSSR